MAELPRYKRPSSLIMSGDVQSSNISALVQAQQLQTQALTKGIDTIVQFALAKSERDQKMDKLQAMQGEAAIMPTVTNAINLLSAEIKTNPKFTPEDFAARQKQILAFVKPVYEKDGATGVAMYNKIQTTLQGVSTKYTEIEVERATAASINEYKTFSQNSVKNLNTSFESNITDEEYSKSIFSNKQEFLDNVSITHPTMIDKFETEWDTELAAMITESYTDLVLSDKFANNRVQALNKINNENFGNRTKTFKALPFELQQKVKQQIKAAFVERATTELAVEEQEDKVRDEEFVRAYAFYDRAVKEGDTKSANNFYLGMVSLADDKNEIDQIIEIDKEITKQDQAEYEFNLNLDIDDPTTNITFADVKKALRLKLIRPEKAQQIYENIIKAEDENRKEVLDDLKREYGFVDGMIFGLSRADATKKKYFKARKIFDKLEKKHYEEEAKRLRAEGVEEKDIFSNSRSPNYDAIYEETVKRFAAESKEDTDASDAAADEEFKTEFE